MKYGGPREDRTPNPLIKSPKCEHWKIIKNPIPEPDRADFWLCETSWKSVNVTEILSRFCHVTTKTDNL